VFFGGLAPGMPQCEAVPSMVQKMLQQFRNKYRPAMAKA
jgi:hypothetical protein